MRPGGFFGFLRGAFFPRLPEMPKHLLSFENLVTPALKRLYNTWLRNALKTGPGTGLANQSNIYLLASILLVAISITGLLLFFDTPMAGLVSTVILLAVLISLTLMSVLVFLMHEQYLANIQQQAASLQRAERKYTNIFDSNSLGIYETTVGGKVVAINQAALDIIGYAADEVDNIRTIDHYVDADEREHFEAAMRSNGQVRDFPIQLRDRNGKELYCLVTSSAIRDSEGTITGYQGILRDFTAQKAAELALRHSERKFRDFFEASTDPIFVEAHSGIILDVNPAACALHGLDAETMIGCPFTDFVPLEHRAKVKDNFENFVAGGLQYIESKAVDPTGRTIPVGISASAITFEGVPAVLLHVRDISKRVAAEEELRRLSVHLEEALEEERKAISRDLHDDLGQDLTALKFDMAFLDRKLKADASTDAELTNKTGSMVELVSGTLEKVRSISARLRPSVLDDMGLLSAMEWHSEDFASRTGIACDLTAQENELLETHPEISTALFRIFQEALTNVARHSGATRVQIDLNSIEGEIIMEISDNGRGLMAEEMQNTKSVGLTSMKERAANMGGMIHLKGVPGKGTSITVTIPTTPA